MPVPGDIAAHIEATLAPLSDRYAGARWVPARHFHLTLVFLGAMSPQDVAGVGTALRHVAARHEAIDVALGTGSGIPRGHDDGVGWLTVTAGSQPIIRLAQDLRRTVGRMPALGRLVHEPSRAWRPHLTVARHASATVIGAVEALSLPAHPITWRAESAVLFRSHLGQSGARYEPIEVAPMRGV